METPMTVIDQDEQARREAFEILRVARSRALGQRPGLRLLAIVAWSAFLGAVVMMAAWLLALPTDGEPVGFGRLATIFVVLWGLSAVPAVAAALLTQPPARAFDPPDGPTGNGHRSAR